MGFLCVFSCGDLQIMRGCLSEFVVIYSYFSKYVSETAYAQGFPGAARALGARNLSGAVHLARRAFGRPDARHP